MKTFLLLRVILPCVLVLTPFLIRAQSDLAVIELSSSTVSQGRTLTFTLLVINNGTIAAANPALAVTIPVGTTFATAAAPAGWTLPTPDPGGVVRTTIASLTAGARQSFSIVVNVPQGIPTGSSLVSTAVISSTTFDINPGDNSNSTFTQLIVPANFDLSVSTKGLATGFNTGGNLTYAIQVVNNGIGPCFSVTLADILPSGSTLLSFTTPTGWTPGALAIGSNGIMSATISSLAPGAVADFVLVVSFSAGFAGLVPSVLNTASVTSLTPDAYFQNNLSTTTMRIISPQPADLSIVMSGPISATAGSNLTYTITVLNNGPSAAQNVIITDNIPGGLTFVSLSSTTIPIWAITTPVVGSSGLMTLQTAAMPVGSSASFTLVVKVAENIPGNLTLVNSIAISSGNLDNSAANNSSSVSTSIQALPCVLVCPSSIVTTNTPGLCGANVSFPVPATSGSCGTVTAIPASGSFFPVGTTVVKVSSTSGLNCSFTVTVIDRQAPVITTCPTVPLLCANSNSTYSIPKLIATDACGIPSISYEISGATTRTGTGADASGIFNTGSSTIRWTVKDTSNNITTCETKITVNSPVTVKIPDAVALATGVNMNTVYPAYVPASVVTLLTEVSGGITPYSYSWSNNETTAEVKVNPVSSTGYRVKVQDASGCTAESAEKVIKVVDISCGLKNNGVQVCIEPPGNFGANYTSCVDASAVPLLLKAGSRLGSCETAEDFVLTLKANPNPSHSQFNLTISSGNATDKVILKVYNVSGILMETKTVTPNTTIQIGSNYPTGVYYAEAVQGTKKATLILAKI